MVSANDICASIDIGTNKIVVLIAEKEDDVVKVIGRAIGASAGVKKGSITNINQAAEAIQKTALEAVNSCKTNFKQANVNISDVHLTVTNRETIIEVPDDAVSKNDLETVIKNAKAIPTSTNKEVLCSMPRRFMVSEGSSMVAVENPLGESAKQLGVEIHIMTVSKQSMNNVHNSLKPSDLTVDELVWSSIASAESCLTQAQKDDGVCVIDIGAGVTNMSIFTDGVVSHSAVFAIAGDEITQRIAYAFDTSFETAQQLKEDYGMAQLRPAEKDSLIQFKQANNQADCYLSRHSLIQIIEQVFLELCVQIKQELKNTGLYNSLGSGFVLAGGCALTQGCDRLFLKQLNKRTRLSQIDTSRIKGNELLISNPTYACALGLLLYQPDRSYLESSQFAKETTFVGKIKSSIFKF